MVPATDFSAETVQAKWCDIFKVMKSKTLQSRILTVPRKVLIHI